MRAKKYDNLLKEIKILDWDSSFFSYFLPKDKVALMTIKLLKTWIGYDKDFTFDQKMLSIFSKTIQGVHSESKALLWLNPWKLFFKKSAAKNK